MASEITVNAQFPNQCISNNCTWLSIVIANNKINVIQSIYMLGIVNAIVNEINYTLLISAETNWPGS